MDEKDKLVLKNAVELLWRKGVNHPNDAAIAYSFTQLVEKLLKEPVKENNKETKEVKRG